jgi:hypothetical protein
LGSYILGGVLLLAAWFLVDYVVDAGLAKTFFGVLDHARDGAKKPSAAWLVRLVGAIGILAIVGWLALKWYVDWSYAPGWWAF